MLLFFQRGGNSLSTKNSLICLNQGDQGLPLVALMAYLAQEVQGLPLVALRAYLQGGPGPRVYLWLCWCLISLKGTRVYLWPYLTQGARVYLWLWWKFIIDLWTSQGISLSAGLSAAATLTVFPFLPLVVDLFSFYHGVCLRQKSPVSGCFLFTSGDFSRLPLFDRAWWSFGSNLRLFQRVSGLVSDSINISPESISGFWSSASGYFVTSDCEWCTSRSGYPGFSAPVSCPWGFPVYVERVLCLYLPLDCLDSRWDF